MTRQTHRSTLTGRDRIRCFWDNLDMDMPLESRYSYVNNHFKTTVMELSRDADIPKGPHEKADRIGWIMARDSGSAPGPNAQKETLSVLHTLGRFNVLRYHADKDRKHLTLQQMEAKGLDEKAFADTLRKVSSFFAWAYDLVVPEDVRAIYEGDDGRKSPGLITDGGTDAPGNDVPAEVMPYCFPLAIIIDNSLSVGESTRLDDIRFALSRLAHKISYSPQLKKCTELYVATCGGKVTEVTDFSTAGGQLETLDSLVLKPFGRSCMADAVNAALDRLQARFGPLSGPSHPTCSCRPLMLILSDGQFRDDMTETAGRIARDFGLVHIYVRGVGRQANMDNLRTLDPQACWTSSADRFFKDVFEAIRQAKDSLPG